MLHRVVTLNESRLTRRPNLADVVQPTYPYHFPLHNSLPDETSTEHPVEILLDGKVSNVLVDGKATLADPIHAFVQRAIQTHNNGTQEQFLALWTDYDVKAIFARRLAMEPGALPVSSLGYFSGTGRDRIVFTIDCGVESLVFLRVGDSDKLRLLNVWKQGPNDYKLSESGELTNGETTLPGNLEPFFNSVEFQTYVNEQVNQFIKTNAPK